MSLPLWVLRAVVVALGLVVWFWTQALIARRGFPEGGIGDRVLDLTAPLHGYLVRHPAVANRLLIFTSLLIDGLGVFLLVQAIFGPSFRPVVGLAIIFALRQVCQGLCALPCPEGMIWRDPGFPSLLVTYSVGNDFFFSGHTAIAVLGALELGRVSLWLGLAGALVAAGEVVAVLALRAHYTMDVVMALAAAFCASQLAGMLGV